MSGELLALGISHKTAAVALRERLAFGEQEASEFAAQASDTAEVREAVVISTCNRTEVYLVVGDAVRAESDVLGCSRGGPRSGPPSSPRRSTRRATATPPASCTASPRASSR